MNLKGLRLDGKFADSALYTWAHAKNILISRGFDEVENEPGDTIFNNEITGTIIGRITTPNDIILYIYNNSTTYIKHLSKTGTLITILTSIDTFLNYNPLTFPDIYIEGVHCYNAKGDLIVAWTTGFHKPMIINISGALTSPITINNEFDLKDIYLFPEFTHNNFNALNNTASTSSTITTGGRLPAAAYFVSLTYEIEPDVNTNFGIISNPIFITENDILTAYRQFKGNATLVVTNKAITINVSNLDITRKYFKLAVIQRTETGTLCFITKRIKIGDNSTDVLIDDIDKLIPFNLNEVIISSPSFDTIKTITQSNRKLRLGNPSKIDKVSLAEIYDNVIPKLTVNWVSDQTVSLSTSKNSYKDSTFIFNFREFRSDEVYALYLGLRDKRGGFYGIYHLPGRIAENGEDVDTNTYDGDSIKEYKLGSTATIESDSGEYYGKMGFWENENERYNNQYGTILADSKVRHHRFPSAGQIHSWKNGVLHNTAKNVVLDNLHLIANDFLYNGHFFHGIFTTSLPKYGTWIPASDAGDDYNTYTATTTQTLHIDLDIQCVVASYTQGMTQYKGRATVTIKKFSKVGVNFIESILYTEPKVQPIYNENVETLHFNYTADCPLLVDEYITIQIDMEAATTGGSIGINDGGSCDLSIYEGSMNQDILGLRISLNWSSIDPTIRTSLESAVDGWEILYAKRTLNNQLMLDQSIALADGIGYRFHGFDSMVNLLNIEPSHIKSELHLESTDYSSSSNIVEVTNYSLNTTRKISKVKKISYLPAYNSATVPSNEGKENCYYFEPLSNTFDKHLVNLINIKDNVYLDFSNQELISTGVVKPLIDTPVFSLYGGDTYIGHNSVITGVITTSAAIWYFPIESVLNSGLRYEGKNEYEKFYPATNILKWTGSPLVQEYITAMVDAGIANYYFYNNDYHLLNNLRQDNIDNELTPISVKFQDRIYSSIKQPDGANSMYWRKFKILDYIDIPNHKGAIYKIIGNDYIVYIQTEYSIFRGIVVDKLVTDNIDAALKTGEMFDRPVQELLDADGSYIKPWNREGTILTPYGLVTVDLDKGSIYIISDKANEISKLGIEDWFRNQTKNLISLAAQPKDIHANLGYDDLYKRLLLTIQNKLPLSSIYGYGALYNKFAIDKTKVVLVNPAEWGRFYNWYCATNSLFPPIGYHLPTRDEIFQLGTDIGGYTNGYKLKEIGLIHWNNSVTPGTNEYGLNMLASGHRLSNGSTYSDFKEAFQGWLSTEYDSSAPDVGSIWTLISISDDLTPNNGTGWSGNSKNEGESVRFIKDDSDLGDGTVTDYDGNIYPLVKIGNQVIMAENYRCTRYNNGTLIPELLDNTEWSNDTVGARCLPGENVSIFCPEGYHIGTNDEWQELVDYLGGYTVAGGKLKELGLVHWQTPNLGATNITKFNGMPSGIRTDNGDFSGKTLHGDFWTNTDLGGGLQRAYALNYGYADISGQGNLYSYGFSIRFIKNNTVLTNGQSGSMIDPEGNIYPTICIGNQEWLAANYNSKRYNDGSLIPNIVDDTEWSNDINGAMCYYDNIEDIINTLDYLSSFTLSFHFEKMFWVCFHDYTPDKYIWNSNGIYQLSGDNILYKKLTGNPNTFHISNTIPGIIKYGYLYNWYAATDARHIAASGAHLPSRTEWLTLVDFIGGQYKGGDLKEIGFIYWNSPNTDATNSSGFKALGGGRRSDTGIFTTLNAMCAGWLSNYSSGISSAHVWELHYNNNEVMPNHINAGLDLYNVGHSIRLIKDSTILTNGETGIYTGNDGKIYTTICIGTQEWVVQNLAETKYRNGDLISNIINNAEWAVLTTEAYCAYNNVETNATSPAIIEYSYDKCLSSSIDFIFNQNTKDRFLLKSIKWVTNVEKDGINYWDETISRLLVYSKNQCSNEISIVKHSYDYDPISHEPIEVGNAVFLDGEWIYNDALDYLTNLNSEFIDANGNLITSALNLSKEYFEKSFFIGSFIIVRLIYDNTTANKKFRISNISPNIKSIL
jgi:uncharacterized protein (TIGR02145 family)